MTVWLKNIDLVGRHCFFVGEANKIQCSTKWNSIHRSFQFSLQNIDLVGRHSRDPKDLVGRHCEPKDGPTIKKAMCTNVREASISRKWKKCFFLPENLGQGQACELFLEGVETRPPDTTRPSTRCFSSSEWALTRKDQPLKYFFKCPPPCPCQPQNVSFWKKYWAGYPCPSETFSPKPRG